VSAVQPLRGANDQGIPIHLVTSANHAQVAPRLQLPEDIRQEIANAVLAGRQVLVSERAPLHGAWQGVGYILEDPEQGTAAYLINGGLNGGADSPCEKERQKEPVRVPVLEIIFIIALVLALILLLLTSARHEDAPSRLVGVPCRGAARVPRGPPASRSPGPGGPMVQERLRSFQEFGDALDEPQRAAVTAFLGVVEPLFGSVPSLNPARTALVRYWAP
jgi:hypothetical protein